MTYTKNGKTYHCTVEATLDVIGGKWKPLILWHLGDNVMRFGELQRSLPGVNAKMLTKQLRELEKDGVIRRTVYPEVPPRVEYAITEFGRTLIPILQALCAWGALYLGIENGNTSGSASQCPAAKSKKGTGVTG
jgi:DNA-binding HxlR family transcriptional regulator